MTITNYGLKTPDGLDATGIVSILNSSATPLSGAATYTGTWEDVSGYDSTSVSLLCDSDCVLKMQFSPDGTNIDSTVSFSVTSGSNEFHRLTNLRKYMRIVIENGSSAQSYMRLQTIKGEKQLITSTLNSIIQQDSDAVITRSITEEMLIAEGKYQDRYIVNKFGINTDIDTGTLPEDIWDGGGAYTGFPTGSAETLAIVSSSTNDTNSSGTGARTLRIFGLDSNKELQQEDVNLNGTTTVNSSNSYTRVYRAYVLTAGSSTTNEGEITINHSTTTANVFTVILTGTGQSQISAYTIPAGYTGYLKRYSASMFDNTTNRAEMAIWMRPESSAVRLINAFVISDANDITREPYGGIKFDEKTDIVFRCTSVDNSNAQITVTYDILVVKN